MHKESKHNMEIRVQFSIVTTSFLEEQRNLFRLEKKIVLQASERRISRT